MNPGASLPANTARRPVIRALSRSGRILALLPAGLLGCLLLGGCQGTAPVKTSVTAPVPVTPMAPEVQPESHTAAALQAKEILLLNNSGLTESATSQLTRYPNFTWESTSGLVLSGNRIGKNLAVVSSVKINRLEVHPLTDGRIRVWIEVRNQSTEPFAGAVKCTFDQPVRDFTIIPAIPVDGSSLLRFDSVSPVSTFTVLIKYAPEG